MNSKKICFILCVNNKMYEDECFRFLQQLEVPEGFEIEYLTVLEAESMASGYNEGMQSSDAKYKVYLHQDVFIVYKGFLIDLLRTFEDEKVGMIGMVGSPHLPEDAVMWNGDRVGRLYAANLNEAGDGNIRAEKFPYEEVEAVDGLLIATQYDIPWREDLFAGWHFYDVSQSMEFRRAGYKVVVPYMEQPWCIHDSEWNSLAEYEEWRQVFVDTYM